jgi:LuxR family maltose regulon positive regulatory protein
MTIQPGSRTEAKAHLRVVGDRPAATPVPPQYRPPRFPADLVGLDRAALWLDRLAQHELALVQAPMGYGKTACCAALFAEAKVAGWRAGWVSFDAGDDGTAAIAHIAAAVHLACGRAAHSDRAAAAVPERAAELAETIDADDRPLLLVLDDADRLAGLGATELLDALLRHPPARLHLVLTGRTAPSVVVDTVERRGMMLRIGSADLALDDTAAAAFLSAAGVTLDALDTARLHELLEGWPAGFRLAVQRPETLKAGDFGGLLARLDAFLAPLIDALPDSARLLLQRCAVAPRLDADLARLLGGDEGGGDRLRDLVGQGLFIEVGEDGASYRLHPAFRAALRRRLDRAEPGRAAQLHRAAARRYTAAGLTAEAIDQALAAADFEQAGALIATAAMPMIEGGHIEQAGDWIAALPAGTIAAFPDLGRAQAWLAVLGAPGAAVFAVACADAPALELLHRAHAADRLDGAIEACDQLLAAPGELSDFAIAMLRGTLAHGALKRGLFGLVHDAVRPLLLRGRGRPLDLPLALAIIAKAGAARAQGQLGEAERLLREAGETVSEPGLAGALIDAALARCSYEREDFEAAAILAARALPQLEHACFQDALLHAFLVAIRIAAREGQADPAAALIDRAELIAFDRGWAPLKALCVVERARLRLPQTIDPEAVLAIADEDAAVLDPLSAPGRAFALLAEMRAYEAIAAGDRPRLTRVAALLLQLASSADDAELRTAATLFNILPQLSGRCDKMVELETVRFLNHAASVGFRRTIVDVLDVTGVRAVQNFCSEAYSSDCFLALLRLADPARHDPALAGTNVPAPGEAFSFLTDREIEILSALNAGESNKEIARTLQLAPETVKWHLKNVMRKLRAGTREEAVLNASTLGLKLIEPGARH